MRSTDPSPDASAEFIGDRVLAYLAMAYAALAFGVPLLLAAFK